MSNVAEIATLPDLAASAAQAVPVVFLTQGSLMNFQCPNCQKMLTVPEQYAGQVMKCPLCAGTFTAPSLPLPMSAPGPLAAAPPLPSDPIPEPTRPAPIEKTPPPPPPAGYVRTATVHLNPRVLPWLCLAALALVFVLLFLPWVGIYPGGVGGYTQNAWQVAFNSFSYNEIWAKMTGFDPKSKDSSPGFSILLIFFLLVFLATLGLAVASVVVDLLRTRVKLPSVVQQLWPWHCLLIGGFALLAFLFLSIELMVGFPLENKTKNQIHKELDNDPNGAVSKPVTEEDRTIRDMRAGMRLGDTCLRRTVWLCLVVVLGLLAVLTAILQFWLDRRGSRPLPRIDFQS